MTIGCLTMTTLAATDKTIASPGRGACGWLAFAASPTFALMAWIAARGGAPAPLCFSGPTMLPLDGMTAMYLLMSLFHLPPWLKLVSATAAHDPTITKGE